MQYIDFVESINIKQNFDSSMNGSKITELIPSTSTRNLQDNNNDTCNDVYLSNAAPYLFTRADSGMYFLKS